jgi:hypothetical protein
MMWERAGNWWEYLLRTWKLMKDEARFKYFLNI